MADNAARNLLRLSWESPSLMTWLNLLSRMLSLLIVLPFVLKRFSEADVSLYFLLFSAIAFQMMFASGLVSTFSRYVSYALAGANLEDLKGGQFISEGVTGENPSSEVIGFLRGTMRRVFGIGAIGAFAIIGPIGTLLLWKPIQDSSNIADSWLAWCLILGVSPITFYGMRFNTVLQGASKIALEQRWAAIFGILSSISGILVLLLGGGLLALIASNQVWLIIGYFRNRFLEAKTLQKIGVSKDSDRFHKALFSSVWVAAWRSMFGIFILNGIIHASGFLYAQFIEPASLATYLLGVRLITAVSQLSRPPFYSKIPMFNKYRAAGEIARLRTTAYKSMKLSHGLFLLGVVCLGIFGGQLLELLDSDTKFPELKLWALLGLSFFLERYGAMHLQIYTTTNHVIWHTATAVSGGVAILLTIVLLPFVGYFSFPAAMIVGHLSYYSSVVPFLSRKSLK